MGRFCRMVGWLVCRWKISKQRRLLELIVHLCLFLLFTYTMLSLHLLINISIVLKQHIVENEGFTDKPTSRNMNENISQKLENS